MRIGIHTKMNNEKKKFFIQYTILFIIMSGIMLSAFFINNKTLVWKLDGEPVLIPEFYYLGRFIRTAFVDFLHGKGGAPLYDFSLGLGKNVFEYLGNWYLEPLSFLSVFAKFNYVEYVYSFCTILRLYLVGITFSAFCFWKKCEYFPTLIGTVTYTFSFYAIYIGLRFPLFLTPMIYFPLFIIAVDLILKKNDVRLLTLMVFLSAWTHYYFFVISTVFLAVYFCVEYIVCCMGGCRHFLKKVGYVFVSYVWGCCMTALVLFLNIQTFLKSNRTAATINTPSLFMYDAQYYKQLWKFFSFPSRRYEIGYELFVAFIPLVLFACIVLFVCKKKKDHDIKSFVYMFGTMLLVPAMSFVVCGFSNINNRWAYILVIFLHFVFCYIMPQMHDLNKKTLLIMAVYPIAYAVSIFLIDKKVDKQTYVVLALIVVSYLVLVLAKRLKKNHFYTALLAMSMINTIIIGITFTSEYGYLFEYADKDSVETSIGDVADYFEGKGNGETFFRVENLETVRAKLGSSVCKGYNSVSDYSNVMSKDTYKFMADVENVGLQENIMYFDMDGRTVLDQMNAVKYVCVRQWQNSFVPYNYQKIDEVIASDDEIYEIYENKNPVSIGYATDKVMALMDYEKLDALDRQGALIEGAVIDEKYLTNEIQRYKKPMIKGKSAKIISISIENGEIKDNKIEVFEKGATIHIEYQGEANAESYLRIKDVDISKTGLYDTMWFVTNGFGQTKGLFLMSDNNYYNPRVDNKTVNLGYSAGEQNVCNIFIPVPGKYKWDGIEISTVSMEQYDNLVSPENREYMEDVFVGKDCITGRINAKNDAVLCLSIPYDKNWRIYIDGKPARLLKTNRAYIGTYITKGEHMVTLRYRISGIGILVGVSSFSILLYVLYSTGVLKKIKEKLKDENSNNGRRKRNKNFFCSK